MRFFRKRIDCVLGEYIFNRNREWKERGENLGECFCFRSNLKEFFKERMVKCLLFLRD